MAAAGISDINLLIKAGISGVSSVITGLKSVNQALARTENKTATSMGANSRAVNRFSHNTGKDFGAMAISLSPVLVAFAEMAGAIYAVGFAYDKIALVAKFTQTKEAFGILADTFNFNAESMIVKLKGISNGTITAFEAMRAASVSAASGLSTKQMEELAVAAKNTSRAMGIDMSDAYTRITRGVTKLEPELLDELGLITRLQGELLKYSREMGITSDKVSSATKIQIFHKAVIQEATDKYASLGKMQKSAAEELETMKNGLVDASLLFGESLIPAILGTITTLKDLSGYFAVIGVALVTYKVQQMLAAKVATAARVKEVAMIGLHSQALKLNTAAKIQNTLADARGAKRVVTNPKTNIAANLVASFSSVDKIIGKVKGGFMSLAKVGAWALGKLTGPFGVVLSLVGLLAESMGWLDGIWETLSGRATDLTSQLEKLNKTQMVTYDLLVRLGNAKWTALGEASKAVGSMSETVGRVTTETALLHNNFKNFTRSVSQSFIDAGAGVRVFLGEVKSINPKLAESTVVLTGLNKTLDVLKENLADAKDPGWGSIDTNKVLKAEAAIMKQEEAISVLTVTMAQNANTHQASQWAAQGLADAYDVNEKAAAKLGASANFTTEKLKAMGLTKLDRLTKKIKDVGDVAKFLWANIKTTKGLMEELGELKTPSAIKEFVKYTKVLEDLQKQLYAANGAKKRLIVVKSGTDTLKLLENELKLLENELTLMKALGAEALARTKSKSAGNPKDLENVALTSLNLEKDYAEKSLQILDEKFALKQISIEAYLNSKAILESEARVVELNAGDALTKALIGQNEKRIRSSGTMVENLILDFKNYAENMSGIGNTMATAFKDVFGTIGNTIKTQIGQALGFLEDKSKTTFMNSLKTAQEAYAGMVKAANDAFGLSERDSGVASDRALQDLNTGRTRDIADLTGQFNNGSIDQAGLDQGIQAINTDYNRAREDLSTSDSRGAEDAEKTRQDSLLEAQEAYNAAILAAEEQLSEDKQKVWDDMYGNIKTIVFDALTDIAVKKAAMWAWEAAAESSFLTSMLGMKATADAAETGMNATRAATNASLSITEGIAKYFAANPFVGVALGVAAGATIMAMLNSVDTTAPTAPTIPTPSTKFHTGGLVTGPSQEIPIIAYKGEGVLNNTNGMAAIGGVAGLNRANSTGTVNTVGNNNNDQPTTVILELPRTDGGSTVITLENFEELLRGAAGKTIRKVVTDGVQLG